MSDRTVEQLAQAFHEAYERLAPGFGYETRAESAVPWADVPDANRELMMAVVGEVVGPLLSRLTAAEAELEWVGALNKANIENGDRLRERLTAAEQALRALLDEAEPDAHRDARNHGGFRADCPWCMGHRVLSDADSTEGQR